MKRIIAVLGLVALAAASAGAQEALTAQVAKRLGLTDRQAGQFIEIYADSATDLAKARAEINVQKALLAKLLLDPAASEREVERILRQAMEAELQVRTIQIHRELAARKLIGDRKWLQLRELLKRLANVKERAAAREALGRQGDSELDARDQALLQELSRLFGE
jgi:hypothetical protein